MSTSPKNPIDASSSSPSSRSSPLNKSFSGLQTLSLAASINTDNESSTTSKNTHSLVEPSEPRHEPSPPHNSTSLNDQEDSTSSTTNDKNNNTSNNNSSNSSNDNNIIKSENEDTSQIPQKRKSTDASDEQSKRHRLFDNQDENSNADLDSKNNATVEGSSNEYHSSSSSSVVQNNIDTPVTNVSAVPYSSTSVVENAIGKSHSSDEIPANSSNITNGLGGGGDVESVIDTALTDPNLNNHPPPQQYHHRHRNLPFPNPNPVALNSNNNNANNSNNTLPSIHTNNGGTSHLMSIANLTSPAGLKSDHSFFDPNVLAMNNNNPSKNSPSRPLPSLQSLGTSTIQHRNSKSISPSSSPYYDSNNHRHSMSGMEPLPPVSSLTSNTNIDNTLLSLQSQLSENHNNYNQQMQSNQTTDLPQGLLSNEDHNYQSSGSNNKSDSSSSNNRKKRQCSECFGWFSNLATHKSIHLGSNKRPHVCEECNRGFARPNDLFRHQKSHRGDAPFRCPFFFKPGLMEFGRTVEGDSMKPDLKESPHMMKRSGSTGSNSNGASGKGRGNGLGTGTAIMTNHYYPSNYHFEPSCHQNGGFSRCDTYKNHLKAMHFEYPPGTKKSQRNGVAGKCKACGEPFNSSDQWISEHVEPSQCFVMNKIKELTKKKQLHDQGYNMMDPMNPNSNSLNLNSNFSVSMNSSSDPNNRVHDNGSFKNEDNSINTTQMDDILKVVSIITPSGATTRLGTTPRVGNEASRTSSTLSKRNKSVPSLSNYNDDRSNLIDDENNQFSQKNMVESDSKLNPIGNMKNNGQILPSLSQFSSSNDGNSSNIGSNKLSMSEFKGRVVS